MRHARVKSEGAIRSQYLRDYLFVEGVVEQFALMEKIPSQCIFLLPKAVVDIGKIFLKRRRLLD